MKSKFIPTKFIVYMHQYIHIRTWNAWIGFESVKACSAAVGDSTAVEDSLGTPLGYLINNTIASCSGDIVRHFVLIKNEFYEFFELKLKKIGFNNFDVSQIFRQRGLQARPKHSY